uniref:Cytochrome c oxidase subunit 2 n=1 Tax=Dryinus sp. ZJUH_2016011 TaxID=2491175 RepID=A0A3S8V0J3_9HYME|nr:cytochrome c oxidase subunit 2 [Dryinus sp. ZJUH_2016011]
MLNWQMMSFQDYNSIMFKYMIFFHDLSMLIIFMITTMIIYLIMSMILNKLSNYSITSSHSIELIWTFAPMIILFILAIPSIQVLYFTEEVYSPIFTIKSIGHQWYWSYEYPEFKNLNFDSFMIKNFNNKKLFRLLDVDNNLVIPKNFNIRMISTSNDVIHSWTIPALGIKIDAIPGRLNQINLNSLRPGLYYGQCSEICGLNHSFMPIVMETTSIKFFINWIKLMFKN